MRDFSTFKKRLLKNREFGKAYEALAPEYVLIESVIRKRIEKGLTQKQLAEKVGTKQSAIARLESGGYNPSVAFLEKVAKALGGQLQISIRALSKT